MSNRFPNGKIGKIAEKNISISSAAKMVKIRPFWIFKYHHRK